MRGIGAKGGTGKGRKRLIIGIIIVVLIIIGMACGGKGNDNNGSDVAEEPETEAIVEEETPVLEEPGPEEGAVSEE